MKLYEFNPTIYPYLVWVIVSEKPDCICDIFNGYNDNPIDGIDKSTSNMQAFVMPVVRIENPAYGVVMYFRDKNSMSYELVAHEASHAAKYLFEHIGADVKEHDPFEFLIGWIAGCCENVKNDSI